MKLDEVIAYQERNDLKHVHVVYLGPSSFMLAHTDEERARHANDESCPVHLWLSEHDEPPEAVGLYAVVEHRPDAYSEPYMAEPWDLEPLDAE